MIPILYSPGETAFDSNGIGMLADTIRASAPQELNGLCEITLRYPAKGRYASEIRDRSIIMVVPDPVTQPQPYRVYRINPVSSGMITAYARHLAYDLSGIIAAPMSAGSAAEAMGNLKRAATTPCPFEFETDKTTTAAMNYPKPRSVWRTMGGSKDSILDLFGGEYEFDRYKVKLWQRRGADRHVEIRYGKNLRTYEMDRNCAEVYTGCYPHWYNEEHGLVEAPNKIIPAEGTYDFTRIYALDLSDKWQEKPTPEEVEAEARRWMKANHIGEPKVSWKIEFVQLEQTEEYKGRALLERVLLGDTVHVIFPEMGVDVSARCVAIDYDPINERYNSITLGSVKSNLADSIVHQNQEIGSVVDKVKDTESFVQGAVTRATDWITNGSGYVTAVRDESGAWREICIADAQDLNAATKVWRWSGGGLGYSKTGYNGPYETAITAGGEIVADFITVGTLMANIIKGGILESTNGKFRLNMETGELHAEMLENRIAEIGVTAEGVRSEVSDLTGEDGRLTRLEQTAQEISITVEDINSNGIKTSTGIEFGKVGMVVSESSTGLTGQFGHMGMEVKNGSEDIITANLNGVGAKNVAARQFLSVGGVARLERYKRGNDSNRVAVYILGGDTQIASI